ncbi:uncharacterized protein LOC105254747 isoform X2 [Camponotus floridanus]|nr:uncharacterized protein LOC105254747 isoform X2 [Camponotus floridanus]
MSRRHLRRLAAQEADIISKNFHKCFLSSSNTKCTTNTGYGRFKSKAKSSDIENETDNIDNNIIQYEQHEDNILVQLENVQSDRQSASESDSQRSSLNDFCDESSNLDFGNDNRSPSFENDLAAWAVEHQISQTALNMLLLTLRKHSCFSTLFVDARTLLKTPRQQDIRIVDPGTYYHFGLLKCINQNLSSVKKNIDCLKIAINIDGLPLTRSSQQQFWPILGSIIPNGNVFMIGLYHGNEKPEDANEFLKNFVDEAKDICENGININDRLIPCQIEALVCDTPAKAFVLSVKGHSGYSSCTKCTTEGEYIRNRLCFPQMDAPLRSDDDFIQKIDDNYHKPNITCSLLNIPQFKPVTNVPLDYMHLVCLGIMRKLLNLWLHGELQYRLQYKAVNDISTRLISQLKPSIPVEFARKPRRLDCVKLWKATEYRQILLYTGPIAFKSILKKDVYIHFMTLHVVIRILSSEKLHEHLSYAQELIYFFVKTFVKLYGAQNVSHNVHSLIHLVDDVKIYGPLDNFSAFQFENYMQILKKYIRKSEKPLQQVVRRFIEKEKSLFTSTTRPHYGPQHYNLMSLHYDGPIISNCHNPQYKVVKFNGMTFKADTLSDSCCGLSCGAIVCIKNVVYCAKRNIPVIIGQEFMEKEDVFNVPCLSSLLDIYSVHTLSDLKAWPLKTIVKKYVKLLYENDKFAVFPFLHSDI